MSCENDHSRRNPLLMHLEISPIQTLNSSIRPPGSKSITNRALLCAALTDGKCRLSGVLDSDDTRAMIRGLGQLGIEVDHDCQTQTAVVSGNPRGFAAEPADVYCENSGTTIRFLCAAVTQGQAPIRLDGNARMRTRPIADLVQALNQLGGQVVPEQDNDCPPVLVHPQRLAGGQIEIDGSRSSQFLSATLMAAPTATGTTVIAVENLVSRPYIEITLAVMRSFGVEVQHENLQRFEIHPAAYRAADYEIEPDASAASYFWAAAAITGGTVQVEGLTRRALQGDVGICDCLAQMGCTVEENSQGITVHGNDPLHGIEVDMRHISDTVQTLAVVALFADSPTRIVGVHHIRRKETDRIGDLARELRKCGAKVEELEDGLEIHPAAEMLSATIDTYDDHRMAMSFAVAGLRHPGMVIADAECVAKTYPGFFDDLEKLSKK